jgi:hypothetical protein
MAAVQLTAPLMRVAREAVDVGAGELTETGRTALRVVAETPGPERGSAGRAR